MDLYIWDIFRYLWFINGIFMRYESQSFKSLNLEYNFFMTSTQTVTTKGTLYFFLNYNLTRIEAKN